MSVPCANPSKFCLQPSITLGPSENSAEIYSVQFSPDGKILLSCCSNGTIRVHCVKTGRLINTFRCQTGVPITTVKFRPEVQHLTKNVFITTDALGCVKHWHMTSGQCLHTFQERNPIFSLDYEPQTARTFVTAGRDAFLRIYDETTKQCILSKKHHSNRIFCVKFVPKNPHVCLSGGWDNVVNIWDVRSGRVERCFYGPHICGEAIDVLSNDDNIVTGSWRTENPLEIWDYGSGKFISSVNFEEEGCMLYAVQRCKRWIAAGGSGLNEATVFDCSSKENDYSVIGSIKEMNHGIFTLDFSLAESKLAVAGGDGTVKIVDIVPNESNVN